MNFIYQFLLPATAHAQVWTNAQTQALVTSTEAATATTMAAAIPIVIPITIGLAVFFFFMGWLLSKARGKH